MKNYAFTLQSSQILHNYPISSKECRTYGQAIAKTATPYRMPLSNKQKSQSPFQRPMAHRAAPISVSIALGHASANAVRATAGGWSTGSSVCLTSPLLSHLSSARREGNEYQF